MIAVALLVAMAPVASASTPIPTSCAPMMQAPSAQHSCCGSGCECTLETQKEPAQQDVPVSQTRIELTSAPVFEQNVLTLSAGHDDARPAIEGSPPKDSPLYEEYSEYRL